MGSRDHWPRYYVWTPGWRIQPTTGATRWWPAELIKLIGPVVRRGRLHLAAGLLDGLMPPPLPATPQCDKCRDP